MLTVVMVVEGVLRMPGSEGHVDTGWSLYQALAKNSQLYLMSAAWTEDELAPWLARRHLHGHLGHLATGPTPAERIDALERIRSWRINLVIETDPAAAAAEIAAGWNTLLHTHALYTQPAWRPDHQAAVRPWDQLAEAIEQQNALRATDNRLGPA